MYKNACVGNSQQPKPLSNLYHRLVTSCRLHSSASPTPTIQGAEDGGGGGAASVLSVRQANLIRRILTQRAPLPAHRSLSALLAAPPQLVAQPADASAQGQEQRVRRRAVKPV